MTTEHHKIDGGGERDIVKEANDIKATITKVSNKSHIINFPTNTELNSQSNSLRPVQLFNYVDYTPDTYYISNLIATIHIALSKDTSYRRDSCTDLIGLTLYFQYQFIYQIFNSAQDSGPYDLSLEEALLQLRTSGILEYRVPINMYAWFENIGTYIDPIFNNHFRVKLPEGNTDIEKANYVLSRHTAHLLPNFKLLQLKALILNHGTDSDIEKSKRTHKFFINANSALPDSLPSLEIARLHYYRIPGMANIYLNKCSEELSQTLSAFKSHNSFNKYSRYLSYTPELLRFLHLTYTPYMSLIDTKPLSNFNTIGGTQLTLCIMESNGSIVIDEIVNNIAGKDKVVTASRGDYNNITVSRTFIENGDVINTNVTPIVRISEEGNRIKFLDRYIEPNSTWYSEQNRYKCSHRTLDDMHSKFIGR